MDSNTSPELLERWSIEFKKGFAKPMILLFLKQKENYPYSLTREINTKTLGAINIAGSNIYPLLSSMKKQGLITSTKSKEQTRTIYKLTDAGRIYLETLQKEITDFLIISNIENIKCETIYRFIVYMIVRWIVTLAQNC